jgi:hypothetical protein
MDGRAKTDSNIEFETQYKAHFGEARRQDLLANIERNLQDLSLLNLEEIDQIISRRLRNTCG